MVLFFHAHFLSRAQYTSPGFRTTDRFNKKEKRTSYDAFLCVCVCISLLLCMSSFLGEEGAIVHLYDVCLVVTESCRVSRLCQVGTDVSVAVF